MKRKRNKRMEKSKKICEKARARKSSNLSKARRKN